MVSSSNYPIISLKRTVTLELWQVLATIGTLQENNTILAILKLIEQYGYVSKEIILDQLLNESWELVAERLLEICKDEGYIDEHGKLTQSGEWSLKNNKVFEQDIGPYLLICIDDVLINQNIIGIQPLSVETWNAFRAKTFQLREKGALNLGTKDIPEYILDINPDRILESYVVTPTDKGELLNEVKIYRIGEKGIKIEDFNPETEIYLNFDLEQGTTTVSFSKNIELFKEEYDKQTKKRFRVPDKTIRLEGSIPIDLDCYEIWGALCYNNQKTLFNDDDYDRIGVSIHDLDAAALKTFRTSIKFDKCQFDQIGNFDSVLLKNVPIRPIDDENAQEWFEWLLADGIGTYMSHDKFKDYAYKIVTN
ncbi:MAG: hypothetical protein ACTSQI_20965, partial [Candidatus Helarchaeota archaeon]